MSIWFKPYTLEDVRKTEKGTMIAHLGIEFTEIGENFLSATMPADHRTKQPYGILHGGASVALAETLASSAGYMTLDPSKEYCVGLEINANHISAVRDGQVQGTATPLHIGRSTQVWETKIFQNARLVCISRMTLAILKKK